MQKKTGTVSKSQLPAPVGERKNMQKKTSTTKTIVITEATPLFDMLFGNTSDKLTM